MKRLALLIFLIALSSCGKSVRMINRKVPEINKQTMNGLTINRDYFKNKITLITFMYIGCQPCMWELATLRKLDHDTSLKDFQILCIAPHTKKQVQEFNTNDSSIFSDIRIRYSKDTLEYEIIAECKKERYFKNRYISKEQFFVLPECDKCSNRFKVDGYPTSFLVNKKGIIKNVYDGFTSGPDNEILQKMTADIKKLN